MIATKFECSKSRDNKSSLSKAFLREKRDKLCNYRDAVWNERVTARVKRIIEKLRDPLSSLQNRGTVCSFAVCNWEGSSKSQENCILKMKVYNQQKRKLSALRKTDGHFCL